uniref:F-box associated beta-propeller type 1 domain-containing protein n=1 Tax=Chenopodium quinoa TaxID=63459 RepID=A0A803L2X5_CHEQI
MGAIQQIYKIFIFKVGGWWFRKRGGRWEGGGFAHARSSYFVNLHLERSLATKTNLHFIFKASILYLSDFDTFDNLIPLDYPFKNRDNCGFGVVGSCNGLLCLQSYDFQQPLIIYNPTTQTYAIVPSLPISPPFSYPRSIFNFGFGYESISRDYRCVRIIRNFNVEMRSIESDVMVYSLKNGSWRKAASANVPFDFDYRYGRCVFLNDAIHWDGGLSENEAKEPRPIVAFNLRDERFSTLPIPNVDSMDLVQMFVGVLDGSLCLSVSGLNSDTDLWVMKEYGAAGSWIKLFSIAKLNGYEGVDRLICYSMSLKKLFVHLTYLRVASVDLDTMEISNVKVVNFPGCTDAHVCVENLLMLRR